MPKKRSDGYVDHAARRKRTETIARLRHDYDIVPIEDLIRDAVKEAWTKTGHDAMLSASLLGMGRTSFYRRLKKYGLDKWT